jgi:very-long-chain (3R)-3-hydroxyacyl-CoA dehydratase
MYTLLLAWSLTEVVRYAFYACKEVGTPPYILSWLRYTTFIVLYPLGVSSELAMVWLAQPIIQQTGLFYYPMPNQANMAFDYSLATALVALLYGPGAIIT